MRNERLDLYAVLGVRAQATQSEIVRAYRVLLRQHHPDTRAADGGAANHLSDVTLQHVLAAYVVLRDPTRRAEYDRNATRQSRPTVGAAHGMKTTPDAVRRPPVVAGPVRWHRHPDPSST